ncbi:MAG: DUF6338 family protein [Thermomicrobiales bacterium]|nr:DUF6338 family protein [Thermomicrobiales bacterium]
MDIPTSIQAIIVVMVVFIPGYIFLTFVRQSVAFMSKQADARFFFAVIAWGGLIHAATIWMSIPIYDWYLWGDLREHWWGITWRAVFILGVVPLIAGILASWVISWDWIDEIVLRPMNKDFISRIESAWDYSIRTGGDTLLRVHLKDGTMIGGSYRDKAFAGPDGDIFLQDVYYLDQSGTFVEKVPDTAGVWVSADTISHILYFRQAVPPEKPSKTLIKLRDIRDRLKRRKLPRDNQPNAPEAILSQQDAVKPDIPEPEQANGHHEEGGQHDVRFNNSQNAQTRMGKRRGSTRRRKPRR